MKKRLISILILVTMLVPLIPAEAMAVVDDNVNTSDNAVQEKKNYENPFEDVREGSWYYDAVRYARVNGFFSGTSATTFDADGTMTRGMFVTVLGRMAGVDPLDYSGVSDFSDVPQDQYYAPYIAWAAKHGITSGTGSERFSPDDKITRQQMATFFVRYFEAFGVDYDTGANITTVPADIDTVDEYARDAVLKLWKAGLLNGDGINFNPKGNATRAETATLSMRTDEAVETWYKEPGVVSDRVKIDPDAEKQPPEEEKPTTGDNDDYSPTIYYEVQFALGSGENDTDVTLPAKGTYQSGTRIDTLSTPFKSNAIFLGWYYDAAMTRAIESGDRVTRNLTLYADMADGTPVSEGGSPNYVSSVDEETNFSIRLSPKATIGDIKVVNISNGNEDVTSSVTASGGIVRGSWKAGQTYRLEVVNNEVLIYYNDVEQDMAVRFYNFTTQKDETLNLSLSNGLQYIPNTDVSNMTGSAFDGLFGITVKQGRSSVQQNTATGTFTYTDEELRVGDTVAIYSGTRPDQRDLTTADGTGNGDVAYVTVTAVDGSTYTYKSAESKDVLFTPDVLPVSTSADIDGSGDNNSITVAADVLDFSDDKYTVIGLDATTTVDVGDFISFYSGTFGSEDAQDAGYTRITAVISDDDFYTITYTVADQEDIMAAMDIYDTREIDGEELLENVDVDALEAQMTAQAMGSGFIEEATQYLAALALETEGFQELRDDMNLQSYSFHLDDESRVSPNRMKLMAASKVEIEDKDVNFGVTTRLEHFSDHSSGLRAEMSLSFKLIVNPDSDNQIHITVTAIFEQEVLLGLNVSGGAIWKWKWIFPYIYDYRINANIDVGAFTGIGITATAMTKSADDDEFDWKEPTGNSASQKIVDIGKQIKNLMDEKDEFFGESAGTNGGGLAEKYASMLENESDWIELFSVELFSSEGSVDIFHILCYGINVDFVVSANMNITIGMTFEYGNAKRYNFSLLLFHKQSSNETIDLETEHYQFDFYVMGTIGIRAGIRIEVAVGLFSLKLASIGVSAEVGAYAQLWGYFYYSLRWEKGQDRQSQFSGAMLIEIGVYLEIKFLAQAFSGTFAYNPTLYGDQWPLWSAGEKNNVYDFAYSQKEGPKFNMVGKTTTLAIPSTIFRMEWMDLTSGDTGESIFDPNRFMISFSNPAFTYDAENGRITLTPPEKSIEESSEMRITWGGSPLAFSSIPIERTLEVKWSDPQNAKYITFDTGGGSVTSAIISGAGAPISLPTPTKQGYDFVGWYYNDSGTDKRYTGTTMPDESLLLFAMWSPSTDTIYTVEYYTPDSSGFFSLNGKDTYRGTTGQYAVATDHPIPTFRHFTYSSLSTKYYGKSIGTIAPDGSLVLKLFYTSNPYTATFTYGEHDSAENPPFIVTKPYGSTIYAPQLALGGYLFRGFDNGMDAGTEITLTGDVTYSAQWDPDPNTPYRVEHYVQSVSGDKYLLLGGENGIISSFGTTGEDIPIDNYKLTTPGLTYSHATVMGQTVPSASIAPGGNTVLKLHYNRTRHQLQWITADTQNGTLSGGDSGNVVYGKLIMQPAVTPKTGYRFDGWYTDFAYTNKADFSVAIPMPAEDITYYGRFLPKTDTTYKVEHYHQNANDNIYVKAETDELTGSTGATVTAEAKIYPNFTENTTYASRKTSGEIAGDGSLVLRLYYDRNTHSAVFDTAGGNPIAPVIYRCGQTVATPSAPTRDGYTFIGWTWEGQATPATSIANVTMGALDMTFTANWVTIPYTISYSLGGGALAEGSSNPVGYTIETADITLINPAKTGYTFAGWTWTGQFQPQQMVTIPVGSIGNRSYTANWTANTYTISFDAGEGTVGTANKSVTYDKEYGTLPEPAYTGHTFAGWYTASSGGTKVESSTKVIITSNQTLYARWAVNQYTISFNTGGGSSVAPITQNYGSAIVNPAAPTRIGYTFTGWDKVIPTSMPAENITVIATWTAKTYIVSFNAAGGTVTQTSKEVTYDSTYGSLPTPTYTGYTFAGWYTASTGGTKVESGTKVTITSNQTLYAHWSLATDTPYTVEFYQQNANDDGYTKNVSDTQTLTGTTNAAVTAPEKVYDSFVENTAHTDRLVSATVKADGSLVLRRYYDRKTFTITFDKNDSGASFVNGSTNQTLRHGQAITYPTVQCEGKTFAGWYENTAGTGDRFTATAMPAGAVKLYAIWTINEVPYTVNHYVMGTDGKYPTAPTRTEGKIADPDIQITLSDFMDTGYLVTNGISYDHAEANGSTTETATTSLNLAVDLYYERSSYTLTWELGGVTPTNNYTKGTVFYGAVITAPAVSKPGYSLSWNSAPVSTMPAQNVTYTASWALKTAVVTLDPREGTVSPSTKTVSYGDTYSGLPVPTRTGHTFQGWYTDKQNGSLITSATDAYVDSDHTLYARWTINQYTITYVTGEGVTPIPAVTRDYGAAITAPQSPTRSGFIFKGWDKEIPTAMPANNVTITAIWEAQEVTYRVECYLQSTDDLQYYYDTDKSTDKKGYVGEQITISESNAYHSGLSYSYTWNPNMGKTSGIATVNGSLVLKLYYDLKRVQASFNAYGGVFEDANLNGATRADSDGDTIVLKDMLVLTSLATYAPIPTRTGYTFSNWKVHDLSSPREVTFLIISNPMHYAYWEPVRRTVTFDGNGNTYGYMSSAIVYYDTPKELPESKYTRTGYNFAGWNTQADGSGTSYADKASIINVLQDLKLYAQWTPMVCEVTFDANGGTGTAMPPLSVTYGEAQSLTLKTYTRELYTFSGWNTQADGRGTAYDDGASISNLTEDTTLYAQWEFAKFTLTFVTGDGATTVAPITLSYSAKVTSPPNPTRNGYVFRGWDPEIPVTMPGENQIITAEWMPVFSIILDSGEVYGYDALPKYYDPSDTSGEGYVILDLSDNLPYHTFMPFAGWAWAGTGEIPAGVTIDGAKITLSQGVSVPLYFKAQWKSKLILNFDVGTVDGFTSGVAVDCIAGTPLPVPVKDHWTFYGWWDTYYNRYVTTVPYDSSITLSARWSKCEAYNAEDFVFAVRGGAQVELMQDIALADGLGNGFGVGDSGVNVRTNINGNGHTIYLGTVENNATKPLFDAIYSGGIVKDLNVVAYITGQYAYGILAERLIGGTIQNCKVYGSVTNTKTYYDDGDWMVYAGGIVALNRGSIEGCENHANVSSNFRAGGIAAINGTALNGNEEGKTTNCDNYGTITGRSSVGGIVGLNEEGEGSDAQHSRPIVSGCTNYGAVSYNNTLAGDNLGFYIGGIVGYSQPFTEIINCTAGGSATVTGTQNVGGIVGYSENSVINECNAGGTTTVIGTQNVGGVVGYANKHNKITSCKVGGTTTVNGTQNVGGIAGYSYYYNQIIYCSIADTTAVTGTENVGGVAGYSTYVSDVISCTTGESTTVTGEQYVGGIAGRSQTIQDCTNGSTIIKVKEDTIWGTITGYVQNETDIINCVGGNPQYGKVMFPKN